MNREIARCGCKLARPITLLTNVRPHIFLRGEFFRKKRARPSFARCATARLGMRSRPAGLEAATPGLEGPSSGTSRTRPYPRIMRRRSVISSGYIPLRAELVLDAEFGPESANVRRSGPQGYNRSGARQSEMRQILIVVRAADRHVATRRLAADVLGSFGSPRIRPCTLL